MKPVDTQQPGGWLPWIGVVAYAVACVMGLSLSEKFKIPHDSFDNPPWYFIRRDFVEEMLQAVALILCFGIAFVALKRGYKFYGWMLAWFTLLENRPLVRRAW